jgi:hypothetical protein
VLFALPLLFVIIGVSGGVFFCREKMLKHILVVEISVFKVLYFLTVFNCFFFINRFGYMSFPLTEKSKHLNQMQHFDVQSAMVKQQ